MTADDPTTADTAPTAPARRRGPGRPRAGSEDKHERILNEAVALFGAHGFAATSLADVAQAAEISKAGLLHHFSSKEQLFAKVLERRDRDMIATMLQDPGLDEDPWKLLDVFVRVVEHNARHRDLVAIYTATAVAVLDAGHPAHGWVTTHLTQTIERFTQALERGKANGLVRADAPSAVIARTVTALSDGLQLQWLCSTTPGSEAPEALRTGMAEEMRVYVEGLKQVYRA
ncbi:MULTISPECIES: TetR/AcrR family transcriptional regulator [unclassified Actinomyces]|uniref:TetR/AcrR family transcriptional regulator n=1 Tax=unclassified Actinomyces TaxID=2609248 RepID=UPI0020178CC0|nr:MULTISPECIES: TetR/AcrR family transcriptional regulator [unclassified Actinomyces]MCL3778145.1 TetR/AcrR family transcriptional regulator [Actinomyces sp. AC-20-1]MCL3789262.1 TetR/AcrR family transcriptional regulator [Actinomyces sp. 187325]MCL3791682.1 TetR/AcrR family transcriptional regulator [Actinomyces sp. 186855]MCL3794278.1 TetR/AcrR family transcriptional regulator [Actinomyces sp. 217892]